MDNGPGKLLWQQTLYKVRLPQPDFSMLSLDRSHRHVATFNQRVLYVLELDNPTKGRRTATVPRDVWPNVRGISHVAWCCGEEQQHLVAAVVGCDVLVYHSAAMQLVGHLIAPCGRAAHSPPIIAWGSLPSVLVTAGNNGLQRGVVKVWTCSLAPGFVPASESCTSLTASAPALSFDGSMASIPSVSSAQGGASPAPVQSVFHESVKPALLNTVPHALSLHQTKSYLAVHSGCTVVVCSTRTGEKVWERDFLTPVRSMAWSVTKLTSLLVLYHKDGEWRLNAPVLVEVDVAETPPRYDEEPQTHTPHPLSGIASVRLHALPLPFAPKLLLVAFSSQHCERLYLRSDSVSAQSEAASDTPADSLYAQQPVIEPSKGIRSVVVRRVDGEKERSLHLVVLYSTGLLVARNFMSRPMDLLLDKQIRLLQERREVEVVKLQSAGTSLESIKLKVKVSTNQVQFLEQTYHSSSSPPVVFFEILAKQGEQMPEVSASNNCLKNDNELSLEDKVLDELVVHMRQAILDAVRENKPWLLTMLDVCHEKIAAFGMFQPSQLKKLLQRPHPPPVTLPAAATEEEVGTAPASSSSSAHGATTPRTSLEQCPFLPIQSPQVCYKRAYLVHPRYSAGVFAPDGRLILYGFGDGGLLDPAGPRSRLLLLDLSARPRHSPHPEAAPAVPTPLRVREEGDPFRKEWRFTADLLDSVTCNMHAARGAGAEGEVSAWRVLLQLILFSTEQNPAVTRTADVLIRNALKAQRFNFVGAMACASLVGYRRATALAEAGLRDVSRDTGPVDRPYLEGDHKPQSRVLHHRGRRCCLPPALYTESYACMRFLYSSACIAGCHTMALEVAQCMGLLLTLAGCEVEAEEGDVLLLAEQDADLREGLVLCAVCARMVRGLSTTCRACMHVSHVRCLRRWADLSQTPTCPLGCGCACSFDWG